MLRKRAPVKKVTVSPASYSLPEDYESAAQWTAAWKGNVGAGNWNRTSVDKAHGTYSIRLEAGSGTKKAYAPEFDVAKGTTFTVSVKTVGANYSNWDLLFAVNADATSYYSIRFRTVDGTIKIVKNGTSQKSKEVAQLPDNSWRDLQITWAVDGKVTWSFGGDTDNWTDASPLTAKGIGVESAISSANDLYVDYWR